MIGKHAHRLTLCLIAAMATTAMLVAAMAFGEVAAAVDPGQIAHNQARNQLYGSGTTTMTTDQFRAIYLRSVALNKRYQLGDFAKPVASTQSSNTSMQAYQARGEWLNAHFGNAATAMSPDEFRALYLRSDALDKLYHLGSYAPASGAAAPASPDDAFDWTTAGIAIAAASCATLLVWSIAVARNRRWHPPSAHSH